jgi:O-antigen ligase
VSRRRNGRIDLESALDPTTVSLASSVLIMMGTLLAIESRSGITAGAAGVLAFVAMSRARMDRDRRGWLLVGLASLMAAATAYANVEALATRAGDVLTNGVAGRRAIWRETWVMARDFWTTGVGAGAYERGMLVYQTSARPDFYFNHAHSEYLQIVTEGGLLLALPLAVALVAGGAEIARRVAADRSPAGWIRVGAASGLVAVAVQSVWETGLQVPANAVLFAILAAIALHEG